MTFQKGHKDLVPISSRRNPETRRKLSEQAKKRGNNGNGFKKGYVGSIGEKNGLWKGEKVSYAGVHIWVKKWKGKPKNCEVCGAKDERRYHWANIDHKYRRVLEDYISMCASCHKKYDLKLLEEYSKL